MPPPLRCASLISSLSVCTKQCHKTAQSRSFSATTRQDQRRVARNRRSMFAWLSRAGAVYRDPLPHSTNYMGAYTADGTLRRAVEAQSEDDDGKKNGQNEPPKDSSLVPNMGVFGPQGQPGAEGEGKQKKQEMPPESQRDLRPFPLNPDFRSQPVLSEELREKIWEKIVMDAASVRDVSAELNVEMHRVAAVVRLMEIEKEWKRIGKPLARPYARAVMSMLPQTTADVTKKSGGSSGESKTHESINDLPLHSATGPQIFYPTSESRHFTRVDAAKIFDKTLLPADDRVPHPELAMMHKDFLAGYTTTEISDKQAERDAEAAKRKQYWQQKQAKKLSEIKVVDRPRWTFRITPVNVDDIGRDGRGPKGVGWRYGVPLMDRRRGEHKIPRRAGS